MSAADIFQIGFRAHNHVDLEATNDSTHAAHITLSIHHDLSALETEWRDFEQHADCTVFQTFDWLATWQRHIGQNQRVKPTIVTGRQHRNLVIIFPFVVETDGFAGRASWLGSGLSNYNAPIIAADFERRLTGLGIRDLWKSVKRLLASRMGVNLIDLQRMPERIGDQPNPLLALNPAPHINNAYVTNLTGDWEAYYTSKRSASTRRTDRKRRKRLAEFGPIQFITAVGLDQVQCCVDALFEQKRAAYARLGVANFLQFPGYRDFFVSLATDGQSRHLTHVSRLDVGSVVAAANYGLVFRGTYFYILAGYDPGELARFGPGSAQLFELLRHSFDQGLKKFDFTIGDEPYKREWSDIELRLYDLVTPLTWRGRLVAVIIIAKRTIKCWIRRNPKIWSLVSRIRSVLGSLTLQR
jgi:CelD/BcsL family acetyltransferase involved in cellulose biosynthesis